ncbi:YfiR family protein [Pelagicoccus sp. SDUM812005]|uniref:YfiR family protein n=1 Tax=Pelagicoccus sp. SDUM812005 TaxID=3041257 RepID=UPI00280D8398|nr:YfiR family protein [Pelagicoccus sp. SDUM812005]MDQ8181633.1 YfiR family protein [Pelagicoccus sp. SDUM812005]
MLHRNYKLLAPLAALLLTLLVSGPSTYGQTLQIDSSTANWIEGFADFVRWQDEENYERITIGVIGAPEVANYLARRAQTRSSKPRIQVLELTHRDSFEGLDIVYVGGGNRKHWKEILEKCVRHRILSISSRDGFVEAGGCVEFVVRRNRLRFYIANENTKACGVVISSKLLELALEPNK